jgi:GxxExxY protein
MSDDDKRVGSGEAAEPDSELDRLAYDTIGAAIEVHRILGPGYLESVYEQAMEVELRLRGIPVETQTVVGVDYKGHVVGGARIDLIVGERLIVELKAVDALQPIHSAQLLSYLRARNARLGLLINFNVPVLRDGIRRIILSKKA